MSDYIVWDIAILLAASKRTSYREATKTITRTLAFFLQDNSLTVRPLLSPDGDLSPTFKIMESDLTDEGRELMNTALDRWVTGIERCQRLPTDTSYLAKKLKTLRGLQPPRT
jgi:hypothetical protein